jgi:serine/threonine-protein kinase
MEDEAPAIAPGTLLAGRFRVVRRMGVGGMGAVYEIEHELTKHRRALKLLHAEMAANAGVVERFLREASAAGRVGNPHIVETFDAGTLEGGEPYLVMEMLRGETLADRIQRGPMLPSEVVDLIGQACDGVQAAHEAGIVHRDLKPDNLFVVDVEGRPFVKILDFGISKFDPGKTGGLALTQEGAALGTPYYMSPEQIRGEVNLDARTDVYALGVILYECLAGRRPFDADSLTQLAVLIHTGKPSPLAQARTDLPTGLPELVGMAMATDREQRIPSARGLRAELERFGMISFRGMTGTGPSPSAVLPQASVAAKSMANSAGGVSVAPLRPTSAKKGQLGPIVAGFSILGLAALAGTFALRSGGSPSAEAASSASPPSAAAVRQAEPAVTSIAPAVPAALAPPGSASATPPAPPPRTGPSSPVVAPTLQAPAPLAPAVVPNAGPAAPQGGPPAPVEKKARRTEEKGLAKDNPFR